MPHGGYLSLEVNPKVGISLLRLTLRWVIPYGGPLFLFPLHCWTSLSYVTVSHIVDRYEVLTGPRTWGTVNQLLGVTFPFHCWMRVIPEVYTLFITVLTGFCSFYGPCVEVWNGRNSSK